MYLQQAVQVATVMEHAPEAQRDLLKVVPLANRESYQALRAYVREWTLAQRTCDDRGPDTSAPMDIGQVKGTKGRARRARKGKARRKARARKTTVSRKETRRQTIPFFC